MKSFIFQCNLSWTSFWYRLVGTAVSTSCVLAGYCPCLGPNRHNVKDWAFGLNNKLSNCQSYSICKGNQNILAYHVLVPMSSFHSENRKKAPKQFWSKIFNRRTVWFAQIFHMWFNSADHWVSLLYSHMCFYSWLDFWLSNKTHTSVYMGRKKIDGNWVLCELSNSNCCRVRPHFISL